MIYQKIDTVSKFADAFRATGRHDDISYEAKEILFNYLEEVCDDTEIDIKDVGTNWAEIPAEDIQLETGCATVDELEDKTTCYELSNGNILYLVF